MRQHELEELYAGETRIRESRHVYREMRDIKDWEKEVFVAFYLDTQHKIISREIVSIGTTNALVTHPREVFRTAISRNANAVIISHNHPSGEIEVSSEDAELTRSLKKAGEIIGIQLLDHVIVSRNDYLSLRDEGYFD